MLIFKIAWRNIWRHKGKSIVIGVIILFGAFIMTIGNAVIAGMDRGIQENVVERFMGDALILSTNQEKDNIIGGMTMDEVEPIAGYPQIREFLNTNSLVRAHLPAGWGIAMTLSEVSDSPNFTGLFGVNFSDYQAMFKSNVITFEGKPLEDNERGLLCGTLLRERTFKMFTGEWITPKGEETVVSNMTVEAKTAYNRGVLETKDNLVLLGIGSDTATDIRLPVKGVMKFASLNRFWGDLCIVDIESFRECFGYLAASESETELSEEEEMLLSTDFDDFGFFEDTKTAKSENLDIDLSVLKEEDSDTIDESIDVSEGSYNAIFVKLNYKNDRRKVIASLNKQLKEAGLDARIVPWENAMKNISQLAAVIRAVLSGFVLFLYFVAAIVIMNTLSMAAIERTGEIGMMRAVGAKKAFISQMFLSETILLSFVFGVAGMLLGGITSAIVASLNITASNDALQMLFGGDTFHPILGVGDVIGGCVMLAFVVFLASLYPIFVARRITPLEAIARD